jgi:hypothetical protein
MTVENPNVKNTYGGNGSTTVFPFTFLLNSEDVNNVVVTLTNEDGAETTTTDFVLSLSDKSVLYPKSGAQPLPNGWKITIQRQIPYTQTLNLISQGTFYAEDIEAQLDRQEMQIQQLAEIVERTVRVAISSDIDPAELIAKIFQTGVDVAAQLLAAQQSASAAQQAAQNAQESESNASLDVVLATNAKNTAEEHRRAAESAAGAAQTARTEAEQSRQEAGKSQTASAASETHVKAMEENITSMKQHIDGINVEVDKAESAAKSAQESAKSAAASAEAAQKAVGTYSKADLDKKFQELDQQNASKFVAKSGDTMTGALTVPALTATGKIKADGGVEGNASTASALSTNVLTFANGTKIWVE